MWYKSFNVNWDFVTGYFCMNDFTLVYELRLRKEAGDRVALAWSHWRPHVGAVMVRTPLGRRLIPKALFLNTVCTPESYGELSNCLDHP